MAHSLDRLLRAAIAHLSVGFARVLSHLPVGFSRRLARALTPIVYRLVPRVRNAGVANLDLAYGDTLTAVEKQRILYGSIENMLIVAFELFHIPKLEGAFLDRNIRVKNPEYLPRDTGCVVIGAHHGNWEWSATTMARRGYKACEIVREFDHPYLDAYIDAVSRIPVLSKEDEVALATRFQNDQDLEAARELVLSHLRFVVDKHMVRK